MSDEKTPKISQKNNKIVIDPAALKFAISSAKNNKNNVGGKITKAQQLKYLLAESSDTFTIAGRKSHIILWFSLLFLFAMIIWAKFAILDEVTTAQGKIIPSQKTKVIQNLEGGIVKEILVKEGQTVEKKQILVKMDDIKFSGEYKEGELKEIAYKIKVARINAELDKTKFTIPTEYAKKFPDLARSEEALYHSRIKELESLNHKRELLLKEINMTKPLVKEGAVSEVEVLRLQQYLNEIEGSISKFKSDVLQELNVAKAEVVRYKEKNLALQDQLARTEVRSPVKGIVKQIYVTTIGGVVKPGMPVMEIVPLDDSLLIEARVNPRDIGFLHPGQEAVVKITAYDFSIYGGLQGTVEHISADTTVDEKGNSYYEIWVRTKKNYLHKDGKDLKIIPGMQASIDVLTGHKTVLDYLLKPILKTKQNALRER